MHPDRAATTVPHGLDPGPPTMHPDRAATTVPHGLDPGSRRPAAP
jgi:hypothetical protein